MMENKKQRCGFVAIVGRPNVGKSTLTNALIGAKISIVSRKSQTTRHPIQGVLTRDNAQFVFIDTPGFQTRHGGAMNRMMNRVVVQTLSDVDVVVHVVEAGKWSEGDENVLPLLPPSDKKHVILVLSKIDAIKNKAELFEFTTRIMAKYQYDAVIPVSAVKNTQLTILLDEIAQRLPHGEFMFDEDTLTDRSMRFISAEILREKIFRLVGDELPYASTVVIEEWNEEDKGIHINACVVVERESHKPILLGAGGQHMKRIATEARQEIADMVGKPVFLEVFIKVRKGWSEQESTLRDLGYE
ncbi:GTP-binding protein Era [Oligella ureolytica]|uniref:GTPase Era n=2 Tax=Oligella ureolytica TaxID=90244 RepID=A0A378XJ70_9BURK|nr:GTP-binding protein Era [Oligella ureolytica]SUA57020.1 GTP-binding protein Era [Oligella ureolytica]